jgi:hypothetical protein
VCGEGCGEGEEDEGAWIENIEYIMISGEKWANIIKKIIAAGICATPPTPSP